MNFRIFHRILVVSLWCVVLLLWGRLVYAYSFVITDLIQDYAAGRALVSGLSIYGSSINELAIEAGNFRGIDNFHPPMTALLFAPFSGLRYRTVFYLWSALSLAGYLAIIRWALQTYPASAWFRQLAQPLLLLWYPFLYVVGTGNISLFVTFLIVAGWRAELAGRNRLTGVLFGLACLVKAFPGMYFVYLWYRRNTPALKTMAATVVAGNIICALVVGLRDFRHYWLHVVEADMADWGSYILNASLYGTVVPAVEGSASVGGMWIPGLDTVSMAGRAVYYVAGASMLGVTCWYAARARRRNESGPVLFGVFTALMLLLSPLTWTHAAVVCIPTLAYLWSEGSRRKLPRWKPVLIVLLLAVPDVMFANWLIAWFAPQKIPAAIYVLTRFGFWAFFLLWYEMLARVRDLPRQAAVPST